MSLIKLWTCLILTMSILPIKSSTIPSPSESSTISSHSPSPTTPTSTSTSTSKLIPKNLTSLAIISEEALTSSHLLLLTHSEADDENEDDHSFLDPERPEAGRWVDGWSVWDMKDWKRMYRVWKGERVVEVVAHEVEGLVVLATEV
ncbi:hypothetical protein BCR39DRAFT_522399 [Naematelia encephala]|uniref:Uncharacterized protein n=1 Tax=Naematelia encephala TaxID=71784 RepID=A0A1Y2BDX9_9TREE|nr:hypothetical protein BCR39DRAFT_522399 [Naematelia encephala]